MFTIADLSPILAERVGFPPDQLPPDSGTPFTDLGLDSLAIVEIQIGVEHAAGIEILAEDAHHFETPQGVIDYVNQRLAAVRS